MQGLNDRAFILLNREKNVDLLKDHSYMYASEEKVPLGIHVNTLVVHNFYF